MAEAEINSSQRPVVLLIHGTFGNPVQDRRPEDSAASPFADRTGWWQTGSPVWTSFRDVLAPEGIALAGDEEAFAPEPHCHGPECGSRPWLETFRWEGANTERCRHQAGQQLLTRLLEFEAEGRDYHLIGHSHGGSVIWIALQKAILHRWRRSDAQSTLCQLAHLRSWSTVGTAFLHFRGTAVGIWYGKAITILALLLCLGFGAWIVQGRLNEWQQTSNPVGEVYSKLKARGAGQTRLSRHPADFVPLQQAGKEIQRTTTGLAEAVHLGARVTPREWVTAGLQILGSLLLVSAPFLTFYLWTHALRTEARNVYREQRAQNQAMLEFGDRWLGLWSSQDEAISGLRATTRLDQTQIIPRLRIPAKKVFESDRIIRFWRPFVRLLIAPVYNRLFGPCADSFVLTRLTRAAQGNNRIGCAIVDVTETPVALGGFRQLHLPAEIDEFLIRRANAAIGRRSEDLLARARIGLSQFAWGSGSLTTMAHDVHSQLAGEELVHTSYFQSDQIRDLLCAHILATQREATGDSVKPGPPPKTVHRGALDSRSALRLSLGVLVAAALLVFGVVEAALANPAYLLIAALVLVGAGACTSPLRHRNRPPGKLALWVASGLGGGLCFSGLAAALKPSLFWPSNHPPDATLWTNPAFLTASLLLGAAVLFVASLTQARRSPLWASLAGWAGLLLLLLLIAFSSWLLGGNASAILLILLAILSGLYHAFSPLKRAQDVFCLPSPAPITEPPSSPPPEPSDWLLEFRKDMRERHLLRHASPDAGPLVHWLDEFRASIRQCLSREADLSCYALPRLGHPNWLALVAFVLLTGGVVAALLAPVILFLLGVHHRPALLGGVALGGWCAVVVAILLSFGPAVRASRGARRGWMARLSLEFFSFAFLTGIAMLLGIAIRDVFFAVPDVPAQANATWLATNPALLVVTDSASLAALNASGAPPSVVKEPEEDANWTLVATANRASGSPQLAAARGNQLAVWDITGPPPWPSRILPGHQAPISAFAYSPTEDAWISASTNREITVWDALRGRVAGHLPSPHAPVRSMAVHPERPEMAVATLDRSVQILDCRSGHLLASATELPGGLIQMEYLPGESGLLALDDGGTLRRLRRTKDRLRFQPDGLPPWCLPTTAQRVDRFALGSGAPGSPQFAIAGGTATGPHTLAGGEFNAPAPLYRLSNLPGSIAALAFSPDGSLLAAQLSETRPPAIWIIDVPAGRHRGTWERLFELSAVAFSPDGRTIATGSWGLIGLWDAETGNFRQALSGHLGTVSGLIFAPGGNVLASASFDDTVKLWDPATGQEIATLRGHSDWVTAVAFSPDGDVLASTSNDKTVKLWDWRHARELATLPGHSDGVTGAAFHPAANLLASASKDGTVRLWDLPAGRERAILRGHDEPVSCVAFSPDGKTLASASLDGSIKLWAPGSLLDKGALLGHRSGVTCLAYTPDGGTLASASGDRSLRLWDTSTRQQKALFAGHATGVRALAISPDGGTLASVADDGITRLWDVPGNRFRQALCPWIFRPVTQPKP